MDFAVFFSENGIDCWKRAGKTTIASRKINGILRNRDFLVFPIKIVLFLFYYINVAVAEANGKIISLQIFRTHPYFSFSLALSNISLLVFFFASVHHNLHKWFSSYILAYSFHLFPACHQPCSASSWLCVFDWLPCQHDTKTTKRNIDLKSGVQRGWIFISALFYSSLQLYSVQFTSLNGETTLQMSLWSELYIHICIFFSNPDWGRDFHFCGGDKLKVFCFSSLINRKWRL